MMFFLKLVKWLPLAILALMAVAFEPIRSGFTFANQPCELITDFETAQSSIFNLRHLISYGVIFLTTALTLRENCMTRAVIATLLFSMFLEVEQSYFITGHCRLRDLIPNLLGIGIGAAVFVVGLKCVHFARRVK